MDDREGAWPAGAAGSTASIDVAGRSIPDDPGARLARWSARDAVVGLDAENEQLRHRVAERDREIAELRARNQQLADRVAQLVEQRDVALRQVATARPSTAGRAYRLLRRTGGRALRRLGLR